MSWNNFSLTRFTCRDSKINQGSAGNGVAVWIAGGD